MDSSPDRNSPESQIDVVTQYKIAFEAWQFQVNSYWQRNSYFAAFQGIALAAAWKILGYPSAIALCVGGISLAVIWYFNNLRGHSYIRYWWLTIEALEKGASAEFALVKDYAQRRSEFHLKRFPSIPYSAVLNSIPVLFLCAWLWMLVASIQSLPHDHRRLVSDGTSGPFSTTESEAQTVRPSPESPFASPPRPSPTASQPADTAGLHSETPSNRSDGQEEEGEFRGYNKLLVPNNFYSSGVAYGVDGEGNRYVLSDLAKEAGLKTESVAAPFSTFWASILDREVDKTIDENRWGDLVSRVLFVVKMDADKGSVGDVKLNVLNIQATRTDLTNSWQVVRKTQFWQHYDNLLNLRLFLVAETISSHHVILNFPDTRQEVLSKAFGELRQLGPETFVQKDPRTIEIVSHLPLVLASKAVEFEMKSSSKNGPAPRLLVARLDRPGDWQGLLNPIEQKQQAVPTVPVQRTVALRSTHFTDTPPWIPVSTNAKYGDVLNDIKRRIFGAGIDEVRFYESGSGFAVGTRAEVTEQNGDPLRGEARFQVHHAMGKKLRGYYVTVDAYPKAEARVSTERFLDLFLMVAGATSLPDNMEAFTVESGTAVRVYVLEFDPSKNQVRVLANGACGSSALAHMAQSGLVKSGIAK